MTERPRASVSATPDTLAIGPSSMRWTGDGLELEFDERGTPIPYRVAGRVRVIPEILNAAPFALDPERRHLWRPIAPRARIEVALKHPGISWSGSAYLDHNRGSESLEEGFRDWQWSRAHRGRDVAVLYEGKRRDGSQFASALCFGPDGTPHEAELPQVAPLSPTMWAMERRTRADRGFARVNRTWEDSPFYARSTLATELWGERCEAVHESLSLTRFASPIVQWMLPYRMPRARL